MVVHCLSIRSFKKEFLKLFYDPEIEILKNVALNHEAPNFEEYRLLITHEDPHVRLNCANNQDASKFKEYYDLYDPYTLALR